MHVSEKAPESHRLIDTAAHCTGSTMTACQCFAHTKESADVLRDGWLFSITFLLESTAECFGTCIDLIGWPDFEQTLGMNKDTAAQSERKLNLKVLEED